MLPKVLSWLLARAVPLDKRMFQRTPTGRKLHCILNNLLYQFMEPVLKFKPVSLSKTESFHKV